MTHQIEVATPPIQQLTPVQSPAHVTIALASFNGARFLGAQLESLLAQTHKDWSLIVSDDCSRDGTAKVVADFQACNPEKKILFLRGPCKGSAQNFLSLLRAGGQTPYLAFCDQDDVWFPRKLERALTKLSPETGPAIYGSRTAITDVNLVSQRNSIAFARRPGFGNALVQNIAGGNTMVLNRASLDILQPASLNARNVIAHDWWCYQMVTGAGGRMIFDAEPSLFYRQHSGNEVGSNDTIRAYLTRGRQILAGRFSVWINGNIEALWREKDRLTPENQERLAEFKSSRGRNVVGRLRGFSRSGLTRQTRRGTVALWTAAVLGRL
ncbi:MAG: glycosyltransferase family 2 protein [Boseongicola sp.]|nr:glycosyltransferase family 2 protein [Boseongicola sp.]